MAEHMKQLLYQYSRDIAEVYGKHLKSVILYGSYARGDFREDSDVDVMILVDLPQEELWEYRKQLMGEVFDINLEYDTMIVPTTVNEAHFREWVAVYPFYQNVQKEGVELYAA